MILTKDVNLKEAVLVNIIKCDIFYFLFVNVIGSKIDKFKEELKIPTKNTNPMYSDVRKI